MPAEKTKKHEGLVLFRNNRRVKQKYLDMDFKECMKNFFLIDPNFNGKIHRASPDFLRPLSLVTYVDSFTTLTNYMIITA